MKSGLKLTKPALIVRKPPRRFGPRRHQFEFQPDDYRMLSLCKAGTANGLRFFAPPKGKLRIYRLIREGLMDVVRGHTAPILSYTLTDAGEEALSRHVKKNAQGGADASENTQAAE